MVNESNYQPQGQHATYPGSGFYFDLPLNRTTAVHMVAALREWDWVDEATRAIILEMTVRALFL